MPKKRRQQMLSGFEPSSSEGQSAPKPGSTEIKGKTAYILDSHSLIYQSFHAMPIEMASPAGQPVGAVHGFIRDILDLLSQKKPDFLFCAFDFPGPTFRHEMYAEYKANRDEMPAELQTQIGGIRRMLEALGMPILERENYEADDVLATFAREMEQREGYCFLVTGDKDCRQLITDRTKMYNLRKRMVYDAAALKKDWGIRPDQVVDFQSLVGDPVDNVPGVPLIGAKTASELLTQYQTLESVVEHAEQVSGKKRRENLLQHGKQVYKNRELVRLNAHVPMEIDWEAGKTGRGVQRSAALALCKEFGFRTLAERIERLADSMEDGASISAVGQDNWKANYRAVTSRDELRGLIETMSKQKRLSIDTETTSPHPRWAELVGLSFACKEGQAYYVPVAAPPGDPCLKADEVLADLKPVLDDETIEKIGQNLKYEIIVLRAVGTAIGGKLFDTMVADYLLDPGERNHSLDDLSERYLRHKTIKIEELIGKGKKQKRMDEVAVDQVAPYAAEDADVPLRLRSLLEKRLRDEKLTDLFHTLEMPLIEVLAEMEFNGIKVDADRLGELSHRHAERLAELEQQIHKLAGRTFNIDSTKQLAEVLFEELKLPVHKKTKSGPSTDVEVLEQLAQEHDLPGLIIRYRQSAKLKSTYLDALREMICPRTGRVHTSFKQDVAATGRLSSKDPNLQNIPVRTQEGREIRSAFLADPPGWQLMTADYSQIELRVMAHFSGDSALQTAFAQNRDIHAQVASEVYQVDLADVNGDMRRAAKAINFGIIYGQSPFGLAKSLNIQKEEAAAFINAYFAQYPGVEKFMDHTLERARKDGYVTTVLGRRRYVKGVRSKASRGDTRQRTLPERIAINTVIQGSAADLIKLAMLKVYRRMRRQNLAARMLLQIHDELVFEAPKEELASLADLVQSEMIAAAELDTPLKVDVKTGDNWGDCQSFAG